MNHGSELIDVGSMRLRPTYPWRSELRSALCARYICIRCMLQAVQPKYRMSKQFGKSCNQVCYPAPHRTMPKGVPPAFMGRFSIKSKHSPEPKRRGRKSESQALYMLGRSSESPCSGRKPSIFSTSSGLTSTGSPGRFDSPGRVCSSSDHLATSPAIRGSAERLPSHKYHSTQSPPRTLNCHYGLVRRVWQKMSCQHLTPC